MKLSILSFSALLSLGLVSCKKKDDALPAAAALAPVHVKIADASWSSATYYAELQNGKTLTIVGQAFNNTIITLICPDIALKEYDMSAASGASLDYKAETKSYSTLNPQSQGYIGGGKVRITGIDTVKKTVSGTFSGIAVETKGHLETSTFTEGVFTDLSYIKTFSSAPSNPPSGQIFRAKVNGVPFIPDTLRLTNAAAGPGVQINTSRGTQKFIISLQDNTPGTYLSNPAYTVQYSEGGLYTSSYVTVSISSYNMISKELKGTFSLNASQGSSVKNITEGSFTVYR